MPKPKPNRLGMYADVRVILDAALAAGGGAYQCPDYGTAVHWRQRAYQFRKLYAETLGGRPSEYDIILMPRIPADSSTVTIRLRQQVGVFLPTSSPVEPIVADNLFDDDLLGEALSFASKLEGEN